MKLSELIEFTIFAESLNTRADLTWEHHGRIELTGFVLGEYWIVIQINPKPIVDIPNLRNRQTAEVSFWIEDPKTKLISHEALNVFDAKQALQVMGIVTNALLEKFAEYDAFVFTAENRFSDYENKRSLYKRIADKLARNHNFFTFNKDTSTATEFLVSKIQFRVNECGEWNNPVLEYVHYHLKPTIIETMK